MKLWSHILLISKKKITYIKEPYHMRHANDVKQTLIGKPLKCGFSNFTDISLVKLIYSLSRDFTDTHFLSFYKVPPMKCYCHWAKIPGPNFRLLIRTPNFIWWYPKDSPNFSKRDGCSKKDIRTNAYQHL